MTAVAHFGSKSQAQQVLSAAGAHGCFIPTARITPEAELWASLQLLSVFGTKLSSELFMSESTWVSPSLLPGCLMDPSSCCSWDSGECKGDLN